MNKKISTKLLQIAEQVTLGADQVAARTKHIYTAVLSKSKYIDGGNFTTIHPADLELLFTEYDDKFFDGQIQKTLGTIPLQFRLSKRMTSAGGQTAYYTSKAAGKPWYEISISTTILFGCFDGNDHRPITTSGIACQDRLQALQRVLEHELVHLVEMLLWGKSELRQAALSLDHLAILRAHRE